jgi:hypothetical protein
MTLRSHSFALGLAMLTISGVPSSSYAADPPVVAIYDIEVIHEATSRSLESNLTDYLATRMGEGGVFKVVPPADIKNHLMQSKVQSFKECYDKKCQVDLGRELAAQKIVSSRISRIPVVGLGREAVSLGWSW